MQISLKRFLIAMGIVLICLVSCNMVLWWIVCARFDGTFEQLKINILAIIH
jgi:hypothetical protein